MHILLFIIVFYLAYKGHITGLISAFFYTLFAATFCVAGLLIWVTA